MPVNIARLYCTMVVDNAQSVADPAVVFLVHVNHPF